MKDPMQISTVYTSFLLSTEDLKTYLDIMSRSRELSSIWDDAEVSIKDRVEVEAKTFPTEKYKDITQAQVLGMSYKEYLDVKRESEQNLSTDSELST